MSLGKKYFILRIKMWAEIDYIRHTGYATAEKMGILLLARTFYRNIIGDPLEPVISLEKIQNQIEIKEVRSKKYLFDLTTRLVLRGYSNGVAMVLAYEAERYFTVLIEKIRPKVLMVWNNWGNTKWIWE